MNPSYRPWWSQVLNHYQPRNLILKGSQSQLRITYAEDSASRTQLLKYLKEKGGVLIEGASIAPLRSDLPWAEFFDPNRDRWEGSDGDPFLSNPKKEFILDEIEFSYSKKVRMSVF